MSVRVMADVWDYGPDNPVDNSVLVVLANHGNDEGQSCHPSIARIAAMLRRSVRTVMRSIQSLENTGWLIVERDAVGGRGNEYAVNVAKLNERRHIAHSPKRQVTRQHVTESHVTESHVTGDIRDTCQVTESHVTRDNGDILYGRTVIEPLLNRKNSLSQRPSTGQEGEREAGASVSQFPQPPPGDGDPVAIARSVCNAYPRNAHLRSHELNPGHVAAVLQAIRAEATNGETTQTDAGMMLLTQVDALAAAIRSHPAQMKFLPPADRFFAEHLYRHSPEYFTRNGDGKNGTNKQTSPARDRQDRSFDAIRRAAKKLGLSPAPDGANEGELSEPGIDTGNGRIVDGKLARPVA